MQIQNQIQARPSRKEDRRSCHNLSFVISLLVEIHTPDTDCAAEHLWSTMLQLVKPVRNQVPN